MDVFITGATGYIGYPVALGFKNAGYNVIGLVRTQNGANKLQAAGITPVVGDLDKPHTYEKVAATADILVHCAFDASSKDDGVALDKQAINTLIKIGKENNNSRKSPTSPPKQFIYTSGVWALGNTPSEGKVDESTPLKPRKSMEWRPKHEKKVIKAATSFFSTVVIRPGCVYGAEGGVTDLFFRAIPNGTVEMVGDGTNVWAMIHKDDLAECYVLAAKKQLDHEVVYATDGATCTVKEMAEAVAESANLKESIKSISSTEAGPLGEGMTLNQRISNEKIKHLLGWQPKHESFIKWVKEQKSTGQANEKSKPE
jgi:nucleoside-diphosphate-sugar epimerase